MFGRRKWNGLFHLAIHSTSFLFHSFLRRIKKLYENCAWSIWLTNTNGPFNHSNPPSPSDTQFAQGAGPSIMLSPPSHCGLFALSLFPDHLVQLACLVLPIQLFWSSNLICLYFIFEIIHIIKFSRGWMLHSTSYTIEWMDQKVHCLEWSCHLYILEWNLGGMNHSQFHPTKMA